MQLDGVIIDTYACSNEVTMSGSIEGIGCFCHEFSHCMGFPDFYDTSYSGWFGMGSFDLMCSGSYNGDTFIPCGYTAHEKMMCGWQEPIVLAGEDVLVENLKSMSEHGNTYIIYNDQHPDEYYMIENRQKTGWDAGYPAKGLMITHVDFDQGIWQDNTPNTKVTSKDKQQYGYSKTNDHQRMTIFHADNDDDSKYWDSREGYYTKTTVKSDLYPYSKNDSLTKTSKPAAALYTKNSKGTKFMEGAILNITQNSDGTMSFKYRATGGDATGGEQGGDDPVKPTGDYLFFESFDQCSGTGANDGNWASSVASKKTDFIPDNDGWDAAAAYGGYQCARFGSSKAIGVAKTPSFTVGNESTLTFRAAAWGNDGTDLQLSIQGSNVLIEPDMFTMKGSEWTTFTAKLTGAGTINLVFTPTKRFFLDDVLVVDATTTAIQTLVSTTANMRIYTLDGRFVGTDATTLRPGIYVKNGRKFVK
jgi:hypothetical protein